ncbi:hypothetical protein [Halomonas elongata]|uniref:hypothetical protein n=1 Tax=Halomonas elongata TaxID=2746 RepID=UPI0023AEAA24|nr:hypothetical protein [Halomonas elongata]
MSTSRRRWRHRQGTSREWTEAELVLLERYYLDMTWRELQARHFPHRTPAAIQCMAHKLGLKKWELKVQEKQPWSEEELGLVARYYPALKAPEIRRRLLPHRSVLAIRHPPSARRPGSSA